MMRIFLAAALAVLAPSLPATTSSVPDRIPIEAFAELPFISDPALSPDGHRIAARIATGGKEAIAIYDLAAVGEKKPKLVMTGAADISWFKWAGGDRLLIGIRLMGYIKNVPLPMSRLLEYQIASGTTLLLGKRHGMIGDDVIFIDPDGRFILLSSQPTVFDYPAVDRIDLADGSSTEVQKSKTGIWNWFADGSGVVRAGVDYGERKLKLYYRASADADLKRIDTRKYPQDDSVIDMMRFINDTDRGIIITNAATGRFGVYEYDFATDTIGKTIFEHPKVDVTTAIMGDDNHVEGISYEDDRPRVKWLDPDYAALQGEVDRTFPGKDNRIIDRSRDGDTVLLWSGGAADPGTYYVYHRQVRRMEIFASPYDKLLGLRFAPVKAIEYQARDGLTIPGYLTLPVGREPKNLPLIVHPHGGPFARDSWSFDPEVQFLANRGYAVFQPNFRGSTGYGRDYVSRGFGQWGTGMVNDIDDGVSWLIRQGIVDPKRICIVGASYGGYAALWSAIRDPERYRCAVSLAGVTDVKAQIRFDARSAVAPRYFKEWKKKVEGEERGDLDAISPLEQASRLSVPVLIAHGEKDSRVPPEQSHKLVKALEKMGKPVDSVFYPEAGHGFTRTEDSIDFMKRVEAFLARNNPA